MPDWTKKSKSVCPVPKVLQIGCLLSDAGSSYLYSFTKQEPTLGGEPGPLPQQWIKLMLFGPVPHHRVLASLSVALHQGWSYGAFRSCPVLNLQLERSIWSAGEFAVLAVLLQPDPSSQQNPALQFALETAHLREFEGPAVIEEPQNLSLISLIPASPLEDSAPQITPDKTLVLMHYTGSLTTPPCSQQVCWYVFLPMVTVAESQVQNFQNFITQTTGMTSNARPLQPLDGRPLEWLQFRVKMPPKSAS